MQELHPYVTGVIKTSASEATSISKSPNHYENIFAFSTHIESSQTLINGLWPFSVFSKIENFKKLARSSTKRGLKNVQKILAKN